MDPTAPPPPASPNSQDSPQVLDSGQMAPTNLDGTQANIGSIHTQGGAAAIGGNVYDNRQYFGPSPEERQNRLYALLADHTSFIRSRLENFVGRENELAEVQRRIEEKLLTGGYVTITGQAGQGKSSLIARLVQDRGLGTTAYHFIPFNPGPDHQVNLLRNLMARLILKYDLSDIYVASESRSVLRDYFPKVLAAATAKGASETIFIDGLDQLEEESIGVRDLGFLPTDIPHGIVFVLGTRPDDTLEPLELLKPLTQYKLPNLSRIDFDRILSRRLVYLSSALADRFYAAMQENALYLDRVAIELAQTANDDPEEIIRQIADNPENLFSISIRRFKRQPQQWIQVIRPILGVLLVAQEPMALSHIRQIIGQNHDIVKDALQRLGGLVSQDGQGRYYLFHLKFRDYLREDTKDADKPYIFPAWEEADINKQLAAWCAGSDVLAIWQDSKQDLNEQQRREYARKHYISHLYYGEDWAQMWAMLDTQEYGQHKVQRDPSMRSFAQDLDLGRLAAANENSNITRDLPLLGKLWRYTLLRCSLAGRADRFPKEAFGTLVLLEREQEAIELAELMTDLPEKASMLAYIAWRLEKRGSHTRDAQLLRLRVYSLVQQASKHNATLGLLRTLLNVSNLSNAQTVEEVEGLARAIADGHERACALIELVQGLVQVQQWLPAEVIARTLENSQRTHALSILAGAIYRVEDSKYAERLWAEAVAPIATMNDKTIKAPWLVALASGYVLAGEQEHAVRLLRQAKQLAQMLHDKGLQSQQLCAVAQALSATHEWWLAETVARSIEDTKARSIALLTLAEELAQAQQWVDAETIANSTGSWDARDKGLRALALSLAQAQRWRRVELLVRSIKNERIRTEALSMMAEHLAEQGGTPWASRLLSEVAGIVRTTQDNAIRADALTALILGLIEVGQIEDAEATALFLQREYGKSQPLQALVTKLVNTKQWDRAVAAANAIEDRRGKATMLLTVVQELVRVQSWTNAAAIAISIEDQELRRRAVDIVIAALIDAAKWERARDLALKIPNDHERYPYLRSIADGLAHAQQWSEVLDVARLSGYTELKDQALEILAVDIAEIHLRENTIPSVRFMEDEEFRNKVLQVLAAKLAASGKWEQATGLAADISKLETRNQTLIALVKEAATSQDWERAENYIDALPVGEWQDRAREVLGLALVEAQQWEQAVNLAAVSAIAEWHLNSRAKTTLMMKLVQAQDFTKALNLAMV